MYWKLKIYYLALKWSIKKEFGSEIFKQEMKKLINQLLQL